MKNVLLRLQLRGQGASAKQAKELARTANALPTGSIGLSSAAKARITDEIGFKQHRRIVTPRLAFASVAILFVALIVLAQSARPGQTLYSLKKGTQQVRLVVQPGFNQEDLNKLRAAEQITPTESSSTSSSKTQGKNSTGDSKTESGESRKSGSSYSRESGSTGSGSSDKSGSDGKDGSSSSIRGGSDDSGSSHGN